MKRKRVNKKTPNGGAYSEIVFLDDKNNVVDESVATKARIIEFTEKGEFLCETYLAKG